jgi:hypothetical protein
MEIIRHLSNEELSEIRLASDEQYVRRTLGGLPVSAQILSDQPGHFWLRQQAAIRARIASTQAKSLSFPSRIAWVAVAAMIALASWLLNSGTKPVVPTRPIQSQTDVDHELLIAVERAIRVDGPEALEPAAILVREISQNSSNHAIKPKKEPNHED